MYGDAHAGVEEADTLRRLEMVPTFPSSMCRGTSLIRKCTPLGPNRRPMPRVVGEWAFSYGRGTPVDFASNLSTLPLFDLTFRLWCPG